MAWSKRLVPWFSLDGGCPPEWRTFPQPYAVGEEIEYYRASSKSWVPAIIAAVDVVAVSYANPKGGHPVQKQLPSKHKDLQPVIHSGREYGNAFYCVGDEVYCHSSSSNSWVQAKVIEADLVVLTYEGEKGIVSKRLPS